MALVAEDKHLLGLSPTPGCYDFARLAARLEGSYEP